MITIQLLYINLQICVVALKIYSVYPQYKRVINWAVCLDLTSTKGARVAQNSKNGEIAKNAFAMSGSRTRDLPSKN